MFKTVLFPVDRSREAQEAAVVVADIVQRYGSRLAILSVLEESDTEAEKPEKPMMSHDAISELLKGAKAAFSQQGIETETLERKGKPAFVICDVADEIEANLIVMGSRGLGLTEEGASESITSLVINLAPCPVLIVP